MYRKCYTQVFGASEGCFNDSFPETKVQKDLTLVYCTGSPFQSQLMILQNAINNWYTLLDNFSDLHAETLSQLV